MTPDEVAAQVEEQAYGFHRQAVGQLALGASSLRHAVELMQWTPADTTAIDAALDLHASRFAEGMNLCKLALDCWKTGQTIRAQAAQPPAPTAPPAPIDRDRRLDTIAATMASTADDARSDLESLAALLRNGTPNAESQDLCAVMAAFDERVAQLKACFLRGGRSFDL